MTKENEIETRKNWRFKWLSLIFEFSHLEYQKDLWFDNKYADEIGWFSEDICQYFDDLYLDDNYEYQLAHQILSNEEYLTIKEFHSKLEKFVKMSNNLGGDFNENDILENKEWIILCELGRIAWGKLKYIVSDLSEREHMDKMERKYLE